MHTGNSGSVAEVFLSQAGPRFELELSHSEHHLHSGSECRTEKLTGAVEQPKRATRSDRPRLAWYGAKIASAHASQRGRGRYPYRASDRVRFGTVTSGRPEPRRWR